MRKANGKCHIQITKNGVDGIIPATAITQRNYLFPILSGVHPWAEFPLGRIGEGPEHTEGHSVSYDAFLIATRNELGHDVDSMLGLIWPRLMPFLFTLRLLRFSFPLRAKIQISPRLTIPSSRGDRVGMGMNIRVCVDVHGFPCPLVENVSSLRQFFATTLTYCFGRNKAKPNLFCLEM